MKLEITNGDLITGEEDIVEEITSFFSSLYSSSHPQFIGIDGLDWSPIAAVGVANLVRPFEEEEVKKMVFACDAISHQA